MVKNDKKAKKAVVKEIEQEEEAIDLELTIEVLRYIRASMEPNSVFLFCIYIK